MEKKWISTVELLNYLKEHPNKEKECIDNSCCLF